MVITPSRKSGINWLLIGFLVWVTDISLKCFIDVKYLGRQGKQDLKPVLECNGLMKP
jgi:hypothetical protein